MAVKSEESPDTSRALLQVDQYITDRKFNSAKKLLLETLEKSMNGYLKAKPPAIDVYIAHYTSVDTIYSILKNHTRAPKKTKKNHGSYLRLYEAHSLNDPNEGKYLKAELSATYKWLESAKDDTESFVCSFVTGKKPVGDEQTIGNKLIFWQSYGKDGLGCSIELASNLNQNLFEKLERVSYGKDGITTVTDTFKHHFEAGKRVHENLSQEEKEVFATEFWKLFDKIKFLYKSHYYREEEEYRYVVIPSQDGPHVKIKYDFRGEGPYLRGYIEVPELKADAILASGSTVFIGPRVEYRNRLCRNLKQIADNVGLTGPAFRPSEIPYRKAW